jgi:hypothetical protein
MKYGPEKAADVAFPNLRFVSFRFAFFLTSFFSTSFHLEPKRKFIGLIPGAYGKGWPWTP